MNRIVGKEIGSLLGKVVKVGSEAGSSAIGRCIRVRTLVNIHNPLLMWTNISMGGVSEKVFFCYERLADF